MTNVEILEIETTVCRRCFVVLDVSDNFCRVCGAVTERGEDAAMAPPTQWIGDPGGGQRSRTADNPLFVLSMVFFVLGPLALPMVWRCAGLSRFWKVLTTALMLGLVAAVLLAGWYIFDHALAPLRTLGKMKVP